MVIYMNNINMAFLLTSIAGLSTLIGTIPIFIKFKNNNKIICSSLAFASGVMICVSITDLIPESIKMLRTHFNSLITITLSFLFILIGILISTLISKFIPDNTNKYYTNTNLYKVGIISMLAIIIHNIPEGIATFISTTKSSSLGISLTIAIALHNIPEGISISVPIYYSTKSKLKALMYTLISALSEPLGAIITYLFLLKYINNIILGLMFSLIAGLMLQISLIELIPESINKNYPKLTKTFFIIGIIFMLLKFFF